MEQYDINGWPIAPERGRYIGEVDDIYYKKVTEYGRCYEPNLWCQRRVYQDELNEFNKHAYQWKTYSFGKITEITDSKGILK